MGSEVQRKSRRKGGSGVLNPRERRRLGQLGACSAIFVTVFLAKGAGKLPERWNELAEALTANADFAAAFTDLGWGLAAGRPVEETLDELWGDIFVPQPQFAPASNRDGPLYAASLKRLEQGETVLAVLTPPPSETPTDPMALSAACQNAVPTPTVSASEPAVTPMPEPTPTPEPAVIPMAYDGPALPEGVTMDKYALGLSETTSPVSGGVTSDFGWREHPLDGEEKFHYGVDLSAAEGTPVLAFAAGTVEYIGESEVYGLYFQIDHGGGVKSFYAHCSELEVTKGQSVKVGEETAKSGASGHVTGPHLHFELKKNGIRLEPLYYIENRQP